MLGTVGSEKVKLTQLTLGVRLETSKLALQANSVNYCFLLVRY